MGNVGNLGLVGADEFIIIGVVGDGLFVGAGVPGFVEWFVVVFVVFVVLVIVVGFCRPYGAWCWGGFGDRSFAFGFTPAYILISPNGLIVGEGLG